jgi:mono/diheme cytochrome c family protein
VWRVQILWKSSLFALEPIPARCSGIASGSPSDDDVVSERGRYLVEELGCVNCHAGASSRLEAARVRPSLMWDPGQSSWLYRWLADASGYRAGAIMPAMLDDRERRDVASYLGSLTESTPSREPKQASRQEINHGKQLFGSFGCAACHQQPEITLAGIGSKMTVSSLTRLPQGPFQGRAERSHAFVDADRSGGFSGWPHSWSNRGTRLSNNPGRAIGPEARSWSLPKDVRLSCARGSGPADQPAEARRNSKASGRVKVASSAEPKGCPTID